jgi:hypothetical protein
MLIPKLSAVFIYTCNGKYYKRDIKRLIRHIEINKETGCWEWIGSIDNDGYGDFVCSKLGNKKTYSAHRVAFEMAMGILICLGLCILHKCDNRKCCNPEHLKLGTLQDNIKDMVYKNRQAVGENHGLSKLTWVQVREIRRLYATGKYSCRVLAIIFLVSHSVIYSIINNKTWIEQS